MKKKLDFFIENLMELKPELISRFHISQLAIFGSFVRGEETSQSDLDILVTFSLLPSLFEFIELQIYLTETLGIKVDLAILEDLKPTISKNVLAEKLIIV
jgi:predicted nucleotidyltransferase